MYSECIESSIISIVAKVADSRRSRIEDTYMRL